MNQPMRRGSRVDAARFFRWMLRFAGYRTSVTYGLIELWLQQFGNEHHDLAARILDAIDFITIDQICANFRQLLRSIEGWSQDADTRQGRWFFVPFSGSVGESGDSMVHLFRMATQMTSRKYNALFIHRSELVDRQPGREDTVVLLDDFAGSGNQACTAWRGFFAELLVAEPRTILILVAATGKAIERVSAETDMHTLCGIRLSESDSIFAEECTYFTEEEKKSILRYCKRADSNSPKGYADSGLLVVLAHRCPNNSIPILHARHRRWQGLFPRSV